MLTSEITTTSAAAPTHPALLELPRLRVQNANAISSPLTWGFPAITAFTGFMTALARRPGPEAGIALQGVGVVCHGFEAQVTQGGYTRSFALTKPSIARQKEVEQYVKDGTTPAIVEEGRVHLDITLVLSVELAHRYLDDSTRAELAAHIGHLVAGMRLAGGSVMPSLPGQFQRPPRPRLSLLAGEAEARASQFKRMRRRWLPGFALVLRDDLLQAHWAELQTRQPQATLLDAWLDMSRINHRATRRQPAPLKPATQANEATETDQGLTADWATDSRPGWLVPMPVGFAALSELHAPGSVAGVRDPAVPFRFVESVYGIGQWISPHRLQDTQDLLWHTSHNPASGLYRCLNHFKAVAPATAEAEAHPDLAVFNADDYID